LPFRKIIKMIYGFSKKVIEHIKSNDLTILDFIVKFKYS